MIFIVCFLFLYYFYSQSDTRDKNITGVPGVPVAIVLGGAVMVFWRCYLFVVHEIVRVQSQRPRKRSRLCLQQQLLQGIYEYISHLLVYRVHVNTYVII